MSQISVFDMKGSKVSDLELNDKVFGIEPNAAVMHAMVVNYLANQRQGTQSTLTRTEVSGGGRKPYPRSTLQTLRPKARGGNARPSYRGYSLFSMRCR